jgi:hypothetical protein
VDLLAGQTIKVGEVQVYREGQTLYVKYLITQPGWAITETHVAVADALEEIPQTNSDNPIPGRFEFSTVHKPAVTEVTVPVDATRWDPTKPLFIAAHAKVGAETAWAAGTGFAGKNWATYFIYTPAPVVGTTSGVWLLTDYDRTVNTFAPDESEWDRFDLDDKLILQSQDGQGEESYNLPSVPSTPGNNHRIWWDRDGVHPAAPPEYPQHPESANTGGIYQVKMILHATTATTGTAYLNIRGLDQGFETDGNWNTIEMSPAGMTWNADMKHLQVFYGIDGYGATHTAIFRDITVTHA